MASRSSSSSSKTSQRCARPRERCFRALPYAITTLSQLGGPLQPPSPARSGGDLSSPRDCLQARSPSSRSPTSVPQPSRHTMETLEQSRRLGCHRGPTRARADRPGPPSCFGAQPRPRAARSAAPCRRGSGCPEQITRVAVVLKTSLWSTGPKFTLCRRPSPRSGRARIPGNGCEVAWIVRRAAFLGAEEGSVTGMSLKPHDTRASG